MDYIRPADCNNEDFRSMWAEFEWENKVAINTNIPVLQDFLKHVIASTNMTCLNSLDETNEVSAPFRRRCISSSLLLPLY